MNRTVRVAAVLVAFAGAALGAGQAPAQDSSALDTPTFKVRVDYVEVDVVVTDRNGNLVRDLKKDDFQVFEDGKPQTVTAFSTVDIPVERFQRPLFAAQPIEPDVRSNERPFDGRMYVAVIDDLHTNALRTSRVRSAARKFITENLGANDLMAIVHTAGASDGSQDFTNNKRLLLAAIDRTLGRKLDSPTLSRTQEYNNQQALGARSAGDPVNDPEEAERAYNARRSLDSLREIAQWFADVHGRRKTILFFSEGIDYDINDVFSNRSATLLVDTTRETVAAAIRGNVSIYGIDPRGLTQLEDESITVSSFPDDTSLGIGQQSMNHEILMSQASLHELSDETGGFAVINRNDFSTAFDRIVRDNSTYYVLAYYPAADKPGKLHKIDVRVNRPGVSVRARKAYMTPKAAAPASEKSAKNAPSEARKMMTTEIREALDSPMPVSGLGMRVFAAPFKGTKPNADVVLGVDLTGRDLRLNTNDKVTLSYMAIDAQGKIRGGNTNAVTMTLKPETRTRIEQQGFRIVSRLELPPGRYQLRVAAHDGGGGRFGSVLYDLEVPDFTKLPLAMSGVALASAWSAGMPMTPLDAQTKALLPVPPSAARVFPQNDELAPFVEVYDNEPSKPHKVDITATVTTDEGKVLFKNDEVRDSTELQGKRGGYGYTTRIPLGDLAPGRYVLTVSARSRLGEGSTVERQLQFTVGARQ